jgi:phthalate 4,5-dioxygenase oxygenase subunit
MLSKENNDLLTQVGPGTPMGNLLRRFWMPALLEAEVLVPDCDPVRLRLLGEDLIAFRDSNGRIGIIEEYCSHRNASLFLGRNEECGIRCVYHGWKFDVDGNCVEMPSEPDGGENLRAKAKLTSYPTVIRGGVVWVYMGPKEFAARPPDFEWSLLPARQRTATKRLQQCNWAQAVEGGIDSSHLSHLHGRTEKQMVGAPKAWPHNKYNAADRHPVFEVKESGYGLLIAARRNATESSYYWRLTQFLLPFYTMIPPVVDADDSSEAPYDGHAWVPMDDHNTWTWSFSANPHRAYTDEEYEWHGGSKGMYGPIDENYRPLLNAANNYLIDRDKQRHDNYTGIAGIANQDAAVQESMGRISNRTREHLGQSDRAIVNFRRLMLNLAAQCAQGIEPEAAKHGELYAVRSGSLVLDRSTDVEKGAAWLLSGRRQEAAE